MTRPVAQRPAWQFCEPCKVKSASSSRHQSTFGPRQTAGTGNRGIPPRSRIRTPRGMRIYCEAIHRTKQVSVAHISGQYTILANRYRPALL
jgi:hypothetical protein